MKRPSNQKIDEMIAQATGVENRAEFEALGQPTVFRQVAEVFRGQSRWINCFLIIQVFLFTGLFGGSIIRFLAATEVRDQIMWAALGVLAVVVIGLLKTWFWMEMNRITIMREIKRIELQVARLARR